MYAECLLCINAGMSACSARPSVHQSVAYARLSVCLWVLCLYPCARRFIFRASICLIFRPSVCMYVRMHLCRDEHTSVCTVDNIN